MEREQVFLPQYLNDIKDNSTSILSVNIARNASSSYENMTSGEPPYVFMGTFAELKVPIYGYISPVIIFCTVVTNVLICMTLLKKNMRTPTNIILLAMAIADMLTGVLPLPVFIYIFTMGNYMDWLPYNWCYIVKFMVDIVPTMFHTTSIWLTVGLAVQRYVYICKALEAKQWLSVKKVGISIIVIYILGVVVHISRCFDSEYSKVSVPSKIHPNLTVEACKETPLPWVRGHEDAYFSSYYWFRVAFINVLPCVVLVILNGLLIRAMRTAQARRRHLLLQNRKSEWKRIQDSNCTTMMLVTVVGLFLLVEMPLGISMILLILQNTLNMDIFIWSTQQKISLFVNFFILLSYPLNFIIYCAMSRQFRVTFMGIFTRKSGPMDREHSQYVSVCQSENGNHKKPRGTVSSATTLTAL